LVWTGPSFFFGPDPPAIRTRKQEHHPVQGTGLLHRRASFHAVSIAVEVSPLYSRSSEVLFLVGAPLQYSSRWVYASPKIARLGRRFSRAENAETRCSHTLNFFQGRLSFFFEGSGQVLFSRSGSPGIESLYGLFQGFLYFFVAIAIRFVLR